MRLATDARARSPRGRLRTSLALLVVLAAGASGCAPNLVHFGYAHPDKVWYHWVSTSGDHSIVVCDVLPDGGESNCVETKI